ncbi:glutathione-disulfide reductase [Halomonas sp. DP8Y7-1]|uniref:glutathione-disulfide reductase n=1 Tax=Halomonas TaxID=2745 RepID=UPI001A8C30D5|nr:MULTISPECIES: glutathione-disulfide reductase [unclassified Halomonas]MBN8411241.1 glutathione-disulfide reductase [Halomonas litopenaei]MBY5985383.1 glutathione-disulfide reductase [Halomonas sp. DP5Y7-2]MBY6029746.1 glutathione-disulfide reductase [Halomonas sp. DP8Y7-1]MED5294041.1 glutathione-disulfide reductase [Pseudomonadota bacterium]
MSQYDYDLFVIGAGSGGVRAARTAAATGAKVAVAEDRYLGGTCVNVGCVPKKLYSYAAHFHEAFDDARGFGWELNEAPSFDWNTLRDNKIGEIKRLNGIYGKLLDNAGVRLINGRAKVVDEHRVEVAGETISAEKILVAVGGWPWVPPFPGSELAMNSNQIFDLDHFPKRFLVLGGGYIAVEFASIFNGLGADAHLVYRGELFLRGFDQEVREFTRDEMAKKGVNLHFNTNIESLEKVEGGIKATLTNGDVLEVDAVLSATGRKPHLEGLGLDRLDIALNENGSIQVNDRFETSVPSILALGDVTGGPELTPVALAEAMHLVAHHYGDAPKAPMNYDNIATAVFCHPNIGTVGLSEEKAREIYGDIRVYTADFRPMKHTLSGSDERCLMKLIVDDKSDVVVGAHMVGEEAGEVIQGIAIAVRAGLTKAQFDATVGIHPTGAEEFVTMRTPTRT